MMLQDEKVLVMHYVYEVLLWSHVAVAHEEWHLTKVSTDFPRKDVTLMATYVSLKSQYTPLCLKLNISY